MVRNYQRKSQRATKYTKCQLEEAVRQVKSRALTLYRAQIIFNIPRTTLYYHVTGVRGQKSQSEGRPIVIPLQEEKRLAQGLRTMEQWGMGVTRIELLHLVADFVTKNNIQTPFKDNVPGNEWFANFKKRHNLSIKKPQAVEYARKKMTDPFIIGAYFDILHKTLTDLDLLDKPDRIWNLDETSFSHDPHKTKIVGAKGKPSSRTTAGPGRENTTVLAAVSSSGLKAPPLIVFKGKNVWDSWLADDENTYDGTAYAASTKGWMESDIFFNYLQKTLFPLFKSDNSTLLIYDGHSTHINIPLIELARANNITILKLPPHTSHLLQPLDLAVFKSVKDTWDQKLVAWQRRNIGLKIPKKQFSELIGTTWKRLDPQVIKNGFRKAGIHPFNRNVIPLDKYHPESLQRWKTAQSAQGILPLQITAQIEPEHSISQNKTQTSTVSLESSSQASSPSMSTCFQPTTSATELGCSTSQISLEPSTTMESEIPSSFQVSFEHLLLNTVRPITLPLTPVKRKKVAGGAEVITKSEVLERLVEERKSNKSIKEKKATHKKGKTESDSEKADDEKEIKHTKKRARTLRKIQQEEFSSDTSEELEEPVYIDSDDDCDPEQFENDSDILSMSDVAVGKWVIVKYSTKKSVKHFVGQVINKDCDGWIIKFTKFNKNAFAWPENEDIDTVDYSDIMRVLPEPEINRRGNFSFPANFDGFNL